MFDLSLAGWIACSWSRRHRFSQPGNLELRAFEQRSEPSGNFGCHGARSSSTETQYLFYASASFGVVINLHDFYPALSEVERREKIFCALLINLGYQPLRSGVPAAIGAFHDSPDALFNAARGHIIHRGPKAVAMRQAGLLKRDRTPQCGLNGKTFARANVVENPSLKFKIRLGPDCRGNVLEGAQVEFRRAVIGVEPIHAKGGQGKTAAFATSRRACYNDHSWAWQAYPPKSVSALAHVLGKFMLQKAAMLV